MTKDFRDLNRKRSRLQTKNENISGGVIAFAIIATLMSGIIFCAIISMAAEMTWYIFPLYLLVHPLIGKLMCEAIHIIGNAIDKVYGFGDKGKWGNWDKESKIIVAALWPISGPIGLVVFSIVLVYGLIFLNIFD